MVNILWLEWDSFGQEYIREELLKMGCQVSLYTWPCQQQNMRENELLKQKLKSCLSVKKYDFVFSLNFFPVAAKACWEHGVKYVSWTYDSPFLLLYSHCISYHTNYIFLFDQSLFHEFKNQGLENVYYLPMAAPVSYYDKIDAEKYSRVTYKAEISFVGSTYAEEIQDFRKLLEGVTDYTRGYLDAIVKMQKEIQGGFLLEELLTPEIIKDLQRVCPIERGWDEWESEAWIYANYFLARQVTAQERQEYIKILADYHQVKLYTPCPTPWLNRVENRGPVDYQWEMPRVFKNSKINLNITLRSIHSGIPLRAMDIMGCGGFLLTNFQEDFLTYFEPDQDFVFFMDKKDLSDKVSYFLSHEEERKKIARNGYEKVKKYHTYSHRIEEILKIVLNSDKLQTKVKYQEIKGRKQFNAMAQPLIEEIVGEKRGNLLLLYGGNNILNDMANRFLVAFQELNYQVFMINAVNIKEEEEKLLNIISLGIEFAMVFNNIGWLMKYKDNNIWDTFQIPCINYIVDHPYYYYETCNKAPKLGILACVDRNHVKYLHKYWPEISNTCFLPLGGDVPAVHTNVEWENRPISVLYVGSCKKTEDLQLDQFGQLLLHELMCHTNTTLEETVEKFAKMVNSEVGIAELRMLIEQQRRVDMCIKHWARIEVIRVLVEAGIDVEVCGNNWEQTCVWGNPHFHYAGTLSQEECLEKMQKSKIVLNVMPWFKNGIHDRVINGMLAGAVSVTDESEYLQEMFESGRDYIGYDLNRLDRLPELVRAILQHEDQAKRMIKSAYSKARRNHVWSVRAKELINTVKSMHTANEKDN